MVQSYKLTTDYDWILEQVDNTLWIIQKSSENFMFTKEDEQEIEEVFKKIREKIHKKKKSAY